MPSSPDITDQLNEAKIFSFKPHHYQDFDPAIAQKLAGLIQQAYKQFDQNQQRLPWQIEGPYQQVTEIYEINGRGEESVPFGFVASETGSNDIFVVLRGTKGFIEWFKDANIRLVSYKDGANDVSPRNLPTEIIPTLGADFGRVTAGFRGIYVSLRQQLIEALEGLPQDSRIFVTGHSLGGALATLAIPDILNNTHFKDKQKIVLYTFASPRCGDRQFAISFQNLFVEHWRIANTEDIVPMLPFPTGNIIKPASPDAPPESELGFGGVSGVDTNPNPIFGFFKEIYDRKKRRMPDYVHTGAPIYFTIHEAALERHHNLDRVYMLGISESPI